MAAGTPGPGGLAGVACPASATCVTDKAAGAAIIPASRRRARVLMRLPRAARGGTGSGWLPVGGQDLVRVGVPAGQRVGVDERGGQPGDGVQQGMLGAHRDLAGLDGA